MRDIEGREDIFLIMDRFYEKLLADELMRPIFVDVAQIDLAKHLPHLVDFWHSILFMTGAYRRNVMEMHLTLHLKTRLEPVHFDKWLKYLQETIQDNFTGEKADLMWERALSIALLMQHKIKNLRL